MKKLMIATALFAGFSAFGKGYVPWSGREPHPAVVNPVCGNEPGTVLSLDGEWTFAAFPHAADRYQFFRRTEYQKSWQGERKIRVPGAWQTQGVGVAVPEPGRVCYGGRNRVFPLRHAFYGNCFYRRTFEVPAAWTGKRIWLKVGGVGNQGWFWVNDMPVAHVFDYCATRKYEITDLVKPGETAKIVAEVTNAGASKRGTAESCDSWGGLLRSVELEATPGGCYIDDAWARGDFDRRRACVNVEVGGEVALEMEKKGGGGEWNDSLSLRVMVEGETAETRLSSSISPSPSPSTSSLSLLSLHLEVPLRDFRPWSPEHPNLYTAKVELVSNGQVVQTRLERFGVRKIEVRGKDFYLNGKPFFMRGCGFHEIEPTTGYFLPDRSHCREKIAMARKAGFNVARLHTRCEWPEFFEVADELGLMLQPELPYYGDFPERENPFEPLEDAKELWENYRRHPSFAIYCGGNEGSYGPTLGKLFYKTVKEMDPDRLVIEQDTEQQPFWKRTPDPRGWEEWRGAKVSRNDDLAKYDVEGYDDFVPYPMKVWPRGRYDPPKPLVAHEYLNLSVKADTRLEPRYGGAWDHPIRRSVRGEWLKRFGLDHAYGDRLQDAQHALQATWQKIGIESARKDPHCDGYYFWSLIDCVFANEIGWTGQIDTENPTFIAQGLYTPFCEEKTCGQTAAGFAAFNSATGVFIDARPERLLLAAGSAFSLDVFFANYGDAAYEDAVAEWKIVGADGVTLVSGRKGVGRQELGAVRKVAAFESVGPSVTKATAAQLVVTVASSGEATVSSWPCWLFPARAKRDGRDLCVIGACRPAFAAAFDGLLPEAQVAAAKVVVADFGSPAVDAALRRGQNVIEIGGLEGKPNVELGWWFLSGIVGAIFETDDPLLRYLPESKVLSTLHFRLFKKGLRLPVNGFSNANLAAISEEGKGCFAHLGARADRRGGRHVFAYGLAIDPALPESLALMDGLVDRARMPLTAAERETANEAGSVAAKAGSGAAGAGADSNKGGAGRL